MRALHPHQASLQRRASAHTGVSTQVSAHLFLPQMCRTVHVLGQDALAVTSFQHGLCLICTEYLLHR